MVMYANESWNKGKTKKKLNSNINCDIFLTYHEEYTHQVDYKVVVLSNDFSTELT